MRLTVCCLFVRGPYPYTAEYVVRLERMTRRYLARPFRFVCLTDRRRELPPAIEAIDVDGLGDSVPPNGTGYWRKLKVFDPTLDLGDRVLYLDLDTLVVAPLDPIVDFRAQLALTEDAFVLERAHLDSDRHGRKLVRRFNGSVIVWDGGTHSELFTSWSPADAQRLSTDQDWIGEQAIDALPMPIAWFPRISKVRPPWPDDAKVVLVKKPKNHVCRDQFPWFDEMWGGW